MKLQTIWVADHIAFSTEIHLHEYYQMIYCQKTGGSFEIGGKKYDAIPGCIYFVKSQELHGMQRGDNMRVTELKFLVEDGEVNNRLERLPSAFVVSDDILVRRLLTDIVSEGSGHMLYSGDSVNAALELLLIKILRAALDNDRGEPQIRNYEAVTLKSTDKMVCSARLSPLIEYIANHLAEPITLDELSDLVHFNKSYLVECFKREYGIPPMKYVNHIRVEKAKQLLTTTDKTITNIAQETGFRSIHYFSRFFKDRECISPQDYRIQNAGLSYSATVCG